MKAQCIDCGWQGTDAEFLQAPDPFHPGEVIYGCPWCKTIGTFVVVCDEPGCKKQASAGWPSAEGYRQTCHEHWRK